MEKRVGVISKCQALGSWVIIGYNNNRWYTLPLSLDSIEPYVHYNNDILVHEYEGQSVPFTLVGGSSPNSFTTVNAKITIPINPKRKLKKLIFID